MTESYTPEIVNKRAAGKYVAYLGLTNTNCNHNTV